MCEVILNLAEGFKKKGLLMSDAGQRLITKSHLLSFAQVSNNKNNRRTHNFSLLRNCECYVGDEQIKVVLIARIYLNIGK